MKAHPPINKLLPFLLTAPLFLAGCKNCDLKTMNTSAVFGVGTLSIPENPSGIDPFLQVTATGFHPGARATLTIKNYPNSNGTGFDQLQDPNLVMNDKGWVVWTKDNASWFWPAFLYPDVDPDVDIWITVVENDSGCFATTSIKQGEFQKPPF